MNALIRRLETPSPILPSTDQCDELDYAASLAGPCHEMIAAEAECARVGLRLMPSGGIMSNRALHAALSVVVALVRISHQERRFVFLIKACRLALNEIEGDRT